MKRWIGFERGINFGGWFSQCPTSNEHYDTFIEENDFAKVANWGIDHIRLPISYELFYNAEKNYIEAGLKRLEKVVLWCRKYHLNLIIDLHKCHGYCFDGEEQEHGFFEEQAYQKEFYELWEMIAKRFGNDTSVAFELLNEVVEKHYMDRWNAIAYECIKRIRVYAPNSKILVGGYWNNHVAAVKDLLLPPDENIVYNFHCYAPLIFTHQGASWVDGMREDFRIGLYHTIEELREKTAEMMPYELGTFRAITDEKCRFGEGYFVDLFAEAVRVAEERNVALYCGEYGVIQFAAAKDILEWFITIHNVFEKYGIGRAAWTYKGLNYDLQGAHLESEIGKLVF